MHHSDRRQWLNIHSSDRHSGRSRASFYSVALTREVATFCRGCPHFTFTYPRDGAVRVQDDSEAAQLARKRKAVDELEMAWVAAHVGDGKGKDAGGGGRLRAIIDTIIGNLQLSITNVHVRYEVGLGCRALPRACLRLQIALPSEASSSSMRGRSSGGGSCAGGAAVG